MDSSASSSKGNSDGPVITDFIDITIKTIDSKNFQFQVENDIQIKAFKERIASEVGIDTESQRMIFCGRVLSDEKTLKEYKIDNGKTIHLVKKAPPAAAAAGQSSTNRTNTANTPAAGDRNRFHSYRSEDGSVFMGTISLDSPNNILNQMVRSIFTGARPGTSSSGGGGGGSGGSGSNDPNAAGSSQSTDGNGPTTGNASIRTRVNYVRRFLGYISTNFQLLEHPNQLPPPPPLAPADSAETQQVFAAELGELFNEAFAVAERLRPQIAQQMANIAAATNEAEAQFAAANHSILMRISHHLAHIIHMLSEFNLDLAVARYPLTLNTLETTTAAAAGTTSSQDAAAIAASSAAASASAAAAAAAAAAASSTASSLLANLPNLSARIEITTPVTASVTGGGTAGISSTGFQNFLQELSRSLGVNMTAAGAATPPPPSAPPAAAAAASSNSSSSSTTTTTSSSSSSSGSTSTSTSSISTATSAAASAPGPSTGAAAATTTTTNQATTTSASTTAASDSQHSHDHEHHHHHQQQQPHLNLSQLPLFTFDPFLGCHSTYTIPEVRSASNIVGGLASVIDQMDDWGGEYDDDDLDLAEVSAQQIMEDMNAEGRRFLENEAQAYIQENAALTDEEGRRMMEEEAQAFIQENANFLSDVISGATRPPPSAPSAPSSAQSTASAAAPVAEQQQQQKKKEEEEKKEVPMETSSGSPSAPPAPAAKEVKRDEAIDALYSDSEGEFTDAISDFPSTSAAAAAAAAPKPFAAVTPVASGSTSNGAAATSDVPANWQSVLPTEWIPVIEADIQRQRSAAADHQQPGAGGEGSGAQPVYSDAYLNGMPKKRRLELKPEEEDQQKAEAKQQRPQYPL